MLKKWMGFCAIILVIGVGLYAYADYQTSQRVKAQLDDFIVEFAKAGQGEISYHDVSVGMFGNNIRIHNVLFLPANPSEPTLSVDTVTVSNINLMQDENRLPQSLKLNLDHAVLTISNVNDLTRNADPKMASILAEALNIENNTATFVYDAELGYDLDETTDELNLHADYDSPDMMKSGFAVKLSNMPKFSEVDIHDENELMRQLSNGRLQQIKITLNDEGLLDRIYKAAVMNPDVSESMQAMGQAPTVENIKLQIQQEMEASLQQPEIARNPMAASIITHSQQFVASESPKLDLTIKAVKPEGLGFTEMMMLMMSNGHPDLVKQLLEINVNVE